MAALLLAISLAISLASLPAQDDAVDQVLNAVSQASKASVHRWDFRVEVLGNRKRKDQRWNSVTLPHKVTGQSARYRTTVMIPHLFAGKKITGGRAELFITLRGPVDLKAEVLLDGKKAAAWPVLDPQTGTMLGYIPLLLTENAIPGTEYAVEVAVSSKGLYPPFEYLDYSKSVLFRSAHLVLEQAEPMRRELYEFSVNLDTGRRMLRRYPPHARSWPEGIDRSRIDNDLKNRLLGVLNEASGHFDFQALENGDTEKLRESMQAVLDGLRPVSQFAKSFTIYLTGNAHIDLAWLWRKQESVEISANTFRSVMENMKEFPELVFAQSQAQVYAWIEQKYPELFERIKEAVRSGNWDIVGGMWVEPDCNLPSGESLIRQILYGQQFFRERFGKSARLGWNPDSFGFNWNLPQIYKRAGIKAFLTYKLLWNDTTVFPYQLFWWEAPDGSRILAYTPSSSYVESIQPRQLVHQLMLFESNTGFREFLVLFGMGDHGGGPNREMLMRMQMLNRLPVFPKLELSGVDTFFDRVFESDLSRLPVWRSELYLETHRGTYTTQASLKKSNRECESLLETAEKAASIATVLFGAEYPAHELESAWKKVLLNHFHDILPGSCITPVFRDAMEDYAVAKRLVSREIDRALSALSEKVSVPVKGWRNVVVFNPLSWERSGVVRIALPRRAPSELSVMDRIGNIVPSQIVVTDDSLGRELLFYARDVPSVGYKVFTISDEPHDDLRSDIIAEKYAIENSYLRVEVDAGSGNITRIFDKQQGKEVLEKGKQGNYLQLFENLPDNYDAWNIKYTGRSWTLEKADSVELLEQGPVRAVIRVKKSFLGLSKANRAPTGGFPSSFFTQDITLYADSPRLDVVLSTDWWEDHMLLKVAFPFAVDSEYAAFEIPYGYVTRPTTRREPWERARFEVPAHRWADLSNEDWGVSLLNDGKYGMDVDENVMRLTLLTSPLWPDPAADRGRHRCTYSIYPHEGDWREGLTFRRAQELNLPLVAHLVENVKGGELPPERSFFAVDCEGVVLSSIKLAEDSKGLILRFVEVKGESADTKIKLPLPVKSVSEVDLMEEKLDGEVEIEGINIRLKMAPYEIRSLRLGF